MIRFLDLTHGCPAQNVQPCALSGRENVAMCQQNLSWRGSHPIFKGHKGLHWCLPRSTYSMTMVDPSFTSGLRHWL